MNIQTLYRPIKQIRQNLLFCLTGFLILLGMKYFYSKAGCGELRWILGPTSKWVTLLSGIAFVYEPEAGYVNHELRMLIAPSCSGFQFMILCTAMFLFTSLWDMLPEGKFLSLKKGLCRITSSFLLSYPLTIFVNGLRIIMAFYLPPILAKAPIFGKLLTPERLHSAIGIFVYFSALLIIYSLTVSIRSGRANNPAASNEAWDLKHYRQRGINSRSDSQSQSSIDFTYMQARPLAPLPTGIEKGIGRRCLTPLLWYLALVLGIPFLNGASWKNSKNFGAFALLVFACCGIVILLYLLMLCIRRAFGRRRKAFGRRTTPPHNSPSAWRWSWGRRRREQE